MPVPCARCSAPLPVWELTGANTAACTSCGSDNSVQVFPALFAKHDVAVVTEQALEGEAACFDHPSKRAVAACHQCGRFVCNLCSVDFGGQVWCPSCVASGRQQSKSVHLDPSRVLYDSMALALPLVVTFIFWPLTVLSGPGVLVFSLMKWKQPLSLVRKSRWRFVVAIILGVLQTVVWIWVAIYGYAAFRASRGL